jgi:hypothetical protein
MAVAEESDVVLAEVSIFLNLLIEEGQFQRLGRSTDEIARHTAALYFPLPVRIEVDLAEGSLFGKITVSGLFAGLAIFGNLDGSIELAKKIYSGSQSFAEVVSERFISNAGANKDQVESVQVRTNAPKQLVRVLERINELEKSTGTLSPQQMQAELHKLRKQLERALPRVPRQMKMELLEQLEFKHLPPFSQWPTRPPAEPPRAAAEKDRLALRRDREIEGIWCRNSGIEMNS